MNYIIDFDDEARDDLLKLSPHTKREVNRVLRRLRDGPDRRIDTQLREYDDWWRAYAGRRWRVIFEVQSGGRIQIKRIRRRRDAYDGIEHPGTPDLREPEVGYAAPPPVPPPDAAVC